LTNRPHPEGLAVQKRWYFH